MGFIISVFATYAVVLLLTESNGPFGLIAKLRNKLKVFQCILCTAVWCGAVIALYTAKRPIEWLITALGLAGAIVFLDRLSV